MIGPRKYGFAGIAVLLGASIAHAQVSQQLIAQLDAGSKNFKNVQADVKFDQYTKVVKDHSISSGPMYVERQGTSMIMGASYTDAGSNSPKVLNYSGGVLQLYAPATKQVDVFKAGANQAKYESFLGLGFGASGMDLERDWAIQDQGPELIDGVKTEKLDLVAKDPGVRNTFSHVTLWIDPTRGISLKRIFFQPNGDTVTAVFSNVRLNGKIDKKPYAIDPKATKVIH